MQGKGGLHVSAQSFISKAPFPCNPIPQPQISTERSRSHGCGNTFLKSVRLNHYKALTRFDAWSFRVIASRVENRRSDCSLPVEIGLAFAAPPQSGLAWFCFLFPLIEPDWQISRIKCAGAHLMRYVVFPFMWPWASKSRFFNKHTQSSTT
jgi:hypothetical protein